MDPLLSAYNKPRTVVHRRPQTMYISCTITECGYLKFEYVEIPRARGTVPVFKSGVVRLRSNSEPSSSS